jgi:NADH-quinone oxidoreductase subunit E
MPLIPQPLPLAGGALLARLHGINAEHGYLPEEELRRASDDLGVPLSQLYSTASFYAAFSFQPRGRHTIQVCLGTACYIRGGRRILEELEQLLGIEEGGTTDDLCFTLKTVYCLGACGLSPSMRIGNDTYGRLKPSLLSHILDQYRQRAAEAGKGGEGP